MIIYTLVLTIACTRCPRAETMPIQSSTVNTSWERKYLLEEKRKQGWTFDFTQRRGVNGQILCPKCSLTLSKPNSEIRKGNP